MGFVRSRVDSAGRTRYLALYQDVKGRQRSAGTYPTASLADKAWRKAEDRLLEGCLGDASRGRQKLQRYVEETWLPHHQMEARTRENYTYYLRRHILPAFGTMRLIEILPADVREWVTDLQTAGVSPSVIQSSYAVLSAIFTTALNDQLTQLHPCKGVKIPPVPKTRRDIVSPDQFDALYAQLPNEPARLLVELDIETRAALGRTHRTPPHRPRRRAAHVDDPAHRPGNSPRLPPRRRLVPHQAITQRPRTPPVRISHHLTGTLRSHIATHRIARDGLIFTVDMLNPPTADSGDPGDPSSDPDLGMTEPNKADRHGTTTAYNKNHDLRHAHASWLLAGGADLKPSKNDSATATSAPPSNTSTPSPAPMTPPWMP